MSLGPTEIIIILFLIVLLFGAKKLPDAARSIGRSMRIFKSEVKEMSNDDQRAEQQQAQLMQQPYVQPQNGIVPPQTQAPVEYPTQQQQQNPQHG
ncbi:preprotein translocase subunit SecA [Corynebacterium ulcerans]|uniref:Sec-independent protein translocase protein TatA n=2 Tax=Corynebacterium ulcerans TaxID=65058 RepID=A0ABD7MT72_CORUL|nr:Sec-independent protein translocase subunit TatA [Corynebacterium ulcerans]AIU30440.1 Sec-independent protein translocase protein [Corynebacterium ulcerans]AKN77030.1 Sec-independent protein translocase protein [Corynebacterium ulcerans FRC58]KKO85128.1 preprotein translocase subunit SecA [Corynebacterium ulcerans]KKO86173.1 preprotein translocase subunit SecA [Corynebacterium ulcerans]KPJ24348.1 preprotein translocase subunit SecA [Corynebacterium ulcerans]